MYSNNPQRLTKKIYSFDGSAELLNTGQFMQDSLWIEMSRLHMISRNRPRTLRCAFDRRRYRTLRHVINMQTKSH